MPRQAGGFQDYRRCGIQAALPGLQRGPLVMTGQDWWTLLFLVATIGFALGWIHEHLERRRAEQEVEYLMGGEDYAERDYPR
jgi:hypothetical protein